MCCPGLVSTVSYYTNTCTLKTKLLLDRCRAFHENLDDKDLSQRQRTQELTETLINTYDVPTLWSEHGIISDVTVRFYHYRIFSSTYLTIL